jgi:hypothetical protein
MATTESMVNTILGKGTASVTSKTVNKISKGKKKSPQSIVNKIA